jgi:lambda repressor-like predicted transcriptional regulator
MRQTDNPPTRINDLDPASFLASARTEPRFNRREQEVIELYRQGASIESLQRRTGWHPDSLWKILDLHRGTPEAEKQFQAAIRLYVHMRSIIERDDL